MASDEPRDSRRCERLPVSFPVLYSGEDGTGQGQAADLSMLGCAVRSDAAVEPKTYLKLQLSMPDGDASLDIELAVVRWSHGGIFGVEFIAFGEVQKNQAQTILMLSHRAGSSGMIDRARGEGSVERKTDYRSIACVGLSALQEQLVDSSLSWLAERESLRFERVELAAAAIVVLDGRSLVAQGVLSTFVQDSTKNFVIIGGSQTFSHLEF